MKKLSVKLQHCYGIQKLEKDFDFVFNKENGDEIKTNTFVIYAPNGVMKTSFAKIFQKLKSGSKKDLDDIRDHIFGREPVIKEIKIDEKEVEKEEIFIIPSFESFYESKNMANLLIDDSLKEKLKDILEKRNNFLKFLEKNSGLKLEKTSLGKKITEIENQLLKDFSIKSFLQNLNQFCLDIDYDFSDIKYSEIFDDSIVKKIQTEEFQTNIKAFLAKSDNIYSKYSFLEKGKFSLGKLKEISKRLKGNSFFVKENKIFLDGLDTEINSTKDLNNEIKKIEDELKETEEFQKIEKLLSDAKGFVLKTFIENRPEIITELKKDKLLGFRKKLWLSYFKQFETEFNELKSSFEEFNLEKEKSIFDNTPWSEAYAIFKERFTVPFEMEIENIKSSVLGESLPKVVFKFWDKTNKKWIKQDREKIEGEILSQGEKRALYLLNIIFEIEAIKKEKQKTLFIIDDIADSFDYKNKYAIIEYLNDISKEENFYQIILTHNFDFFRTVQDRILDINKWTNSFLVEKHDSKINFIKAGSKNITNPFDRWKKSLNKDLKSLISSIPFVRNLIEYKEGNKCSDYLILTHLLHQKEEQEIENNITIKATGEITLAEVENIFLNRLNNISFEYSEEQKNKKIIDLIFELSDKILNESSSDEIFLENKIILAIAIRLKAEKIMWSKVTNKEIIKGNQTGKLYQRYKEEFGNSDREILKILESVNIMTPENIHLNSFMYEPILDMGINDLNNLYTRIKDK